LILACAFAATTQVVGAKMPTVAIVMRARFIVYLPWFEKIVLRKSNARVKANVPNDAALNFLSNRRPCRAG